MSSEADDSPARPEPPASDAAPAELRSPAGRDMSSGTFDSLDKALSPRLALFGVLSLIALVHLPLLGYQFVYDDGWTLVANGFLRVPTDLGLLFSSEAVARHVPDAFRPGLVVFDLLGYQLLGLSSGLHHALSIGLHLGVCAVLVRWLRALGAPFDLALGTAALFGLLALHAEAVAVVSYREDLLAALLGLAAALAATRGRLAAAALLSLGACSMKLSAGAIPALWLLAEGLSPWRPRPPAAHLVRGVLALGLGVAAVLAYTFALYGALDPYGADNLRVYSHRVGLGPVLAASLPIHLGYLQQMLVPFGLSPEYPDHGAGLRDPAVVLAGAALLALAGYGLACVRRRPLVALAILGAFALALPTSNLFPMPNMRADRFMYLPSVPACLGLVALLLAAGRWLSGHVPEDIKLVARVAPLAAVVVVQGSVRVATAAVYRDNSHLWGVARERAPDSARAHAVLGELVVRNVPADAPREDKALAYARAEAHCRNAERHDPRYELPQLCFARLAAAREDWPEAYRRYQAALAVSPDRNAGIFAGLAEVSLDLPATSETTRTDLARRHLAEGLASYPYSPELHATAGRIFHRLGDPEQAAVHYRRSLDLAPERPEALLANVELLLDLGRPADATELLLREKTAWLAADPDDRTALVARHRDALRLFDPSTILSADPVGVFAHEP
ncbi:tetratricopeptide repeat protein [Nannocystis pusilla]|uniref:tetratricopeptide repeat protein n=1 Tax=Nannocystis pusilla TaxID=889268 RepID=UPI003BF40C78